MNGRRSWSFSALSTYLQKCSLQYAFRYVARLEPERTSSRIAFGSAIHAALEAAYRAWKPGEEAPYAPAHEAFEADLSIRLKDPILEFKDGETPEGLIEQGKALLSAWAEETSYEEVIATEHEFRVPVAHPRTGEGLGVDLTGLIDLLVRIPDLSSPLVVDFKTSARRYSPSQLDGDLQSAIYGYAVRKVHRVDDVPMRWDILVKTKKPGIQRIEFERGPASDLRLFELVRAAEQGVAAGVFHPNDGSMWCSGCAYSNACSKWHENPAAFRPVSARAEARRES